MSRRAEEMKKDIERKLMKQFPPRAFRKLTFDRAQIRADIRPLSFDEARRRKGPIYKALQEELYRDGCCMVAQLLECLAEKEQQGETRVRISDERPLLYKMVDKLKEAELAVVKHKNKGLKESYTSFYEVLVLLEPYRGKYEYVVNMVMEKVVSLCHKIDGQEANAIEMITRIYFRYALYLTKTRQYVLGIEYFNKSLNLARGHTWIADLTNPFDHLTLHERITQTLAEQLLLQAKRIVGDQPKEAERMARLATIHIAEIGKEQNLNLYCDTYLVRAYVLKEAGNFREAMFFLDLIQTTVMARTEYTFVKLTIKYFYIGAQCSENIEETETAMSKYKKALRLAQIYEYKDEEADILVSMGKIFAKSKKQCSIAKNWYEQASKIYGERSDMQNKRKVNFLIAKLKADELTPHYMDMLKESSTQYSALFKLRQWKNRCRPFWNEQPDEIGKQETNNIDCLINEENPDASEESNFYGNKDYRPFMDG